MESTERFTVRGSGAAEISCGGIRIKEIFPYADETPILPFFIKSDGGSLRLEAGEGSLELSFRADGDELIISTEIEGFAGVHDIEPLGRAVLEGADHVYAQGFGMEGPSGCFVIGEETVSSHGIIGLEGRRAERGGRGGGKAPDTAAALFTTDQRDYSAKFSVKKEKTLYTERTVFTAGINLECTGDGSRLRLPDIHIITGSDVTDCMRRAAERIAGEMGARTHMEPGFHWCSWYYHYENLDQSTLERFLGRLEEERAAGGSAGSEGKEAFTDFRYIQIDAGYTPHIGDWLVTNHRYPGGLEEAAASISKAGFEPGIWIAPFMAGDQSELYREHPDWVVRNRDGSPYVRFRSYTEPKIWGNTDNDYYVLDVTHPGAYEYLRSVFMSFRDMGFRLYKTDFILWGMADSSEVIRYDGTKTSVQILRMTLSLIREAIGDESYLLGSIAPFMPCIGFMDGMRIASDMGAQWTEGAFGPANLLQELPYDNYFNNVFWQNDPDSVILRDFATHLTEDETRSIALLQALSGGIITTSDPVDRLTGDRRRLLRFIRPGHRVHADFPFLTSGNEELVITHSLHDWDLLFVLNPAQHPLRVHYRLSELFGEKALFQYRFDWSDGDQVCSSEEPFFSETLAPHESALLFITEEPMTEKPSNLWDRGKS